MEFLQVARRQRSSQEFMMLVMVWGANMCQLMRHNEIPAGNQLNSNEGTSGGYLPISVGFPKGDFVFI